MNIAIVGTGLIGGSLGLALRRVGSRVVGFDADPERLERALARGAVDVAASSPEAAFGGADVAFVAVPVSGVAGLAGVALAAGVGAVSDVGSVKAPVVRAVAATAGGGAARFVGGHPMAGSETHGIEGADADLFAGATWVLTPTGSTEPDAFAAVRDLVGATGAEVVAVEPELHDALVATVSHLPHLVAAALMHTAAVATPNQDTLLRLAAGGFRAMTRLSGRDSGIWPDICVENAEAIVAALEHYQDALERAKELVRAGRRDALLQFFDAARAESARLPARSGAGGPLVELAIPVPDRPGVLAEVTTLAGHQGVNITDLEIAHSGLSGGHPRAPGKGGVLVMVVPAAGADAIVGGLVALGYRVERRDVS